MKESYERMIEEKQNKTIKQKIQMEKTLQDIEDLKRSYQIKLKEANLRKEKELMKSNKKIKREEAMRK